MNALHRDISEAGTTSTVMGMTSIRTWKRTYILVEIAGAKCEHNLQDEIHLINIEQQQKEKVSRKLIKQSFC